MPNRKLIPMGYERHICAQLLIDLANNREANGRHKEMRIGELVILCAVMVGHLEARHLTALKVTMITGLPRTTVLRSLEQFVREKVMERKGTRFLICDSWWMSPDQLETAKRAVRAITDAARKLSVVDTR